MRPPITKQTREPTAAPTATHPSATTEHTTSHHPRTPRASTKYRNGHDSADSRSPTTHPPPPQPDQAARATRIVAEGARYMTGTFSFGSSGAGS